MERNNNWRGSNASGAGRDGKSFDKRGSKPFNKGTRSSSNYKSDRGNQRDNDFRNRNDDNSYRKENQSGFDRNKSDNRNSFRDNRNPFNNRENRNSYNNRDDRNSRNSSNDNRNSFGDDRNTENKRKFFTSSDRKPYENNNQRRSGNNYNSWGNQDDRNSRNNYSNNRPRFVKKEDLNKSENEGQYQRNYQDRERPRFNKPDYHKPYEKNSEFVETRFDENKSGVVFRKRKNSPDYDPDAKYSKKKQLEYRQNYIDPTKPIRLNKFLANAGICSRREADEYIQAGIISVNGQIVTELGTKVMMTDSVKFHDQPVRIEKKIYLLLNKPKDCVTTSEDTHARLTVMDLVKNACSERIYPVGRLDRNTTGVLLLTNDGDLASKLTHPTYEKKKIYQVGLDKDLTDEDFNQILTGIDLGDFTIKADALDFIKENNRHEVGIEIHSGQNRVVRRIFEKLGYKITKLDRVYFAGLTKKGIPRGKYRFLTEREVSMLKMGAYE